MTHPSSPGFDGFSERPEKGHPLGVHRVLDSLKVLPQGAMQLDNSLPIYPSEILLEVDVLNIDAASFVQMESENQGSPDKIAACVLTTVKQRGKQQNAVTGSGGMLIGRIAQIGSQFPNDIQAWQVGDKVATLVSLSLTPLYLEKIIHIDNHTHQVQVKGYAILFSQTILAKVPQNIPATVALAVYDVCGAPAYTHHLVKENDTIVIIGAGGKAGLLSVFAASDKLKKTGCLIAIEPSPSAASDLKKLIPEISENVLSIDARDPMQVYSQIDKITDGKMADLVINVSSAQDTEMGSILAAKGRGKVVFFSMATSFTKVALGAEGIASTATLLFGNGYVPNHSQFAISLLTKHQGLYDLFCHRYH